MTTRADLTVQMLDPQGKEGLLGLAVYRATEEWSHRSESNRGPVVYETTALPLSYGGGRRGPQGCGRDFKF